MVVKGGGKAPGSVVELVGRMQLRTIDAGTTLMDWQADVIVSGTLASVGARLLNSTAEKLTGQFFTCLKTKMQIKEETISTE